MMIAIISGVSIGVLISVLVHFLKNMPDRVREKILLITNSILSNFK